MLYAFLDTTALHHAYRLRGPDWDSIEQAISRGVAVVVTSEVTVAELVRQAPEDATKVRGDLEAAARAAERFGLTIDVPPIDYSVTASKEALQRRIVERGVVIVPRADVTHEDMLLRDFGRVRPFKPSGEGYRDSLIWLTFLGWIRESRLEDGDEVYFISNNTTQFAWKSGSSHKLLKELDDEAKLLFKTSVELLTTVDELTEILRPLSVRAAALPPAQAGVDADVVAAAREAAEALAGAPIGEPGNLHRFGGAELKGALPPLEEATAQLFELLEGGKAQRADVLDGGDELWAVTLRASVELEGLLHKHDRAELSRDASILDSNWNDHYLWVSLHRIFRLRYTVRISHARVISEIDLSAVTLVVPVQGSPDGPTVSTNRGLVAGDTA